MTLTPTVPLALRVLRARLLNDAVREFTLGHPDGSPLPDYTAGAHVRVQVVLADGRTDWRHYSLVNLQPRLEAMRGPAAYVIAVRRESPGRGGSTHLHERVREGDTLVVEPPRNEFELHDGAGGSVLLAGGIGVTPLASMAARCRAQGRRVRMHYAGRQRAQMAYLADLQALLGSDLTVHADDEAGATLDLAGLLDGCAADERLYVCGPKGLLEAVLAATHARGWPHERVHFEVFSLPEVHSGDRAFEIELAQSGRRLTVRADQSILDCLIEHGCDPMFDCRRGECGVCAATVLAGEIDHRDYVLTARERAAGQVIQTCISRALGARLVLDL